MSEAFTGLCVLEGVLPVEALEEPDDPELEPDELEEPDPLDADELPEPAELPALADPEEAALLLCAPWFEVELEALPEDVCEVPAPRASASLDASKVKGFAVPDTQMQTM